MAWSQVSWTFDVEVDVSGPGARFSKVPKSFRARKAATKILNL